MKVKDTRELWVRQHPTIEKWLENYEEPYAYTLYGYGYFRWVETEAPEPFLGKSPEQLLDMQDRCVRQRERFNQVDLLKKWLRGFKGTFGTKQSIKSIIYSFYAANHVPLPRDATWRITPSHESVNGELTIQQLKHIILSSNKMYSAVFTIMFQSSMGSEEITYFNTHRWEQVKKQLDEGKKRIRVDLPGRKHRNMRPGGSYFTFFGKDGITKLKEYLDLRGHHRPGRKPKADLPSVEEAIFVGERWKPLSKQAIGIYFRRRACQLGIIKKQSGSKYVRYKAHPHEMRDTFRTEWNLTQAKGFMAEFFMGHSIDKNKYNKVMQRLEWAEEQYTLAEPFLNILSEDPRTIETKDIHKIVEARLQEKTVEIERLKEKIERWEESMKRLEKIDEFQHRLEVRVNQRLKEMRAALEKEPRRNAKG